MNHTERSVLDALHQRLCKAEITGSRRYALAEHVRLDPTWPQRILDAVAVDTWRSGGYGLHGYEVKVSKSDLAREVAHPEKAGAFEQWLDSFTIVAPIDVLNGWRKRDMPSQWGVMALTDEGQLRYLRKPPAIDGYSLSDRQVPLRLVASLSRATAYTASVHCASHGAIA